MMKYLFQLVVICFITYIAAGIVFFYFLDDPDSRKQALKYAQAHFREHDETAMEHIRAITENPTLALADSKSASKFSGTKEFCKKFSSDLTNLEDIHKIVPIAVSNSYDDEVFKSLHGKCPRLALNKSTHYDAYNDEEETFVGTTHFKGYMVDIDNDPSNGEEYVLYSERHYQLTHLITKMFKDWAGGIYQAAHLKTCSPLDNHAMVGSSFSYKKPEKTGSYSEVISYQRKSYFLDVKHTPYEASGKLYHIYLRDLGYPPVCALVIDNPSARNKPKQPKNW